MKMRLTALMRKANVDETDAEATSLVHFLLKHVITKREYEAVFGDGNGATAFAKRHGLSARQETFLVAMQVGNSQGIS